MSGDDVEALLPAEPRFYCATYHRSIYYILLPTLCYSSASDLPSIPIFVSP